jgi:hypothetical protein
VRLESASFRGRPASFSNARARLGVPFETLSVSFLE